MRGFFESALRVAPSILIIVAIVNFVVGLFTTWGRLGDPLLAVAASLNSGLVPFIAAALLYRVDLYLIAASQSKQSGDNA